MVSTLTRRESMDGAQHRGHQLQRRDSCEQNCEPVTLLAEAFLALKDLVAISNGSACTSPSYTASHVVLLLGPWGFSGA